MAVNVAQSEKAQRKKLMGRIVIYLLLNVGVIIFILPFLWLMTTSVKSIEEMFKFPPVWIPDTFQWGNYYSTDPENPGALQMIPFVHYLGNTLFILVFAMVGTVMSSALCAYGFARLNAPGKKTIFAILLATMMLPHQVTMIPVFIMFQKLGWVNTFKPLIIPAFFGGGAFNIFLLRQFFMTIPKELEEAANIDGCSRLGTFFRIILPLSKPAMITVTIFSFMWMWNDFMGPLIYLYDIDKYTLALGLNLFRGMYATKTPWGPLMAASFMMILPMVIVFFFAQKYFIQGIATTGMKS